MAKTAAAQTKDDTVFCYVRVTGYCMNIFDVSLEGYPYLTHPLNLNFSL